MFVLPTLSAFLDNLEEGVLFLDRSRRVIAINEAATRMIGFNEEVALNQLCPTIFAGTPCADGCEERDSCTFAQEEKAGKKIQDLVLRQPGGGSAFLRMWALLLPPNEMQLHCVIILRDRSREVELEQEVKERLRLGSMVGHSEVAQVLYEKILRAAASDATVLVTGESGTGKELVARALHDNSPRAAGPYIALHCSALPENLLEAELFGHAKGAFTGASAARAGRFEAANGGTLLLDEIGEISPGIQVKLLRVLQEREIVRLGENHARHVDVRVIAATHRDLGAMVQRGEFREDLYYRLRVLPVHVPPLRERKEDITLIANKLLDDLAKRYRRDKIRLAHAALLALEGYDWPGNIRQLSNALEYAVVHSDDLVIQAHHLPPEIKFAPMPDHVVVADREPVRPAIMTQYHRRPVDAREETKIIKSTLASCGGNKAEAARKLGMSRTTLWKRLKSSQS